MLSLRPILRSAPRAARCLSTQSARLSLRGSQVARPAATKHIQVYRAVAAFSTSSARFQSDGQGGLQSFYPTTVLC